MNGPSDGLHQIDRFLPFAEKRVLGCDGLKKRGEKTGKKNRFRDGLFHLDQLIHKGKEAQEE